MRKPIKRDKVVANIVAWLIAVAWLLPFIGLFMVSVRPYREVITEGWWSIIGTYTVDNYIEAWSHPSFSIAKGYVNSFIIAIPSTVIPVACAALAAYAFSRFSFPVKTYLFLAMVLIMAVPQQMTVIPLFMILKEAGLLNTFQGLILIHSAWGMAWIIFFLKNFFDLLPRELEEAARVDGASDFTVFRRVILPMSLPGILSAAVLQFSWVWSDFFYALVFLIEPSKWVVTQRIASMKGEFHVDWGLITAGSVMAMAVPLVLYTLLQRYYVRGFVGWTLKR